MEARSQKPEARSQKQEVRSEKPEVGTRIPILASGSWLLASFNAPAPVPAPRCPIRWWMMPRMSGSSATTTCRAGRLCMVTTKSDPANGNWVYVGHHESFRDGKPLLNPITGKMEFNGTSILEISDPAHPKLVWHIPNDTNRNSRSAFPWSTTTSSIRPDTTI